MRRAVALALLATTGLVACSSSPSAEEKARKHLDALVPTYAPQAKALDTSSTSGPAGSPPTTTTSAGSSPTTGAGSTFRLDGFVSDAQFDTTRSLESPPAWADLIGGHIIRSASAFEIRIKVRGGSAPQRTPDGDHTMNIGCFFDVDGDGKVDYEIWGNVASGGWGASWFDDVHHTGGYLDASDVTITPEGDEVVFRLPVSHIGSATRFRWSVASEWGRYEVLGTLAASRDSMPDGDQATAFPGGG